MTARTNKRLVSDLIGGPVKRHWRGRHRTPGFLARFYARLWVWLVVLR